MKAEPGTDTQIAAWVALLQTQAVGRGGVRRRTSPRGSRQTSFNRGRGSCARSWTRALEGATTTAPPTRSPPPPNPESRKGLLPPAGRIGLDSAGDGRFAILAGPARGAD